MYARSGYRACLTVGLLLMPAVLMAAGQAELSDGATERLKMEYDDQGRVRVEAPARSGHWRLEGTRLQRVEATGLAGPVNDAAPPEWPVQSLSDVAEFLSLDQTSKEETVGGIPARRYLLCYRDAEGQPQRIFLWLSRDSRARELSHLLQRLQESLELAEAPGARQLSRELHQRGLGLLRVEGRYEVQAVEERAPAAARLDPPAPWQALVTAEPRKPKAGSAP